MDLWLHFLNVHQSSSIFHKKKDEFPTVNISEIIDSERRGYLNV